MERKDLSVYDLPDTPGVYLFTLGRGRGKKVLYVGKATSLRDRVRSYFDDDLIATRGPRVVDMVTQAEGLSFEPTPTVLEALVREAALIKQYYPKANVEGKDDKTFLYVGITKEDIPRVITVRGKDVDLKKKTTGPYQLSAVFGPFPSGIQLKEALRLIRKIFPFYDTDRPLRALDKHGKAKVEFNRQIGQYPKEFDAKAYKRSMRNVVLFLSGDVSKLRKTLTKEMQVFAKAERFEEASEIRRQLFALDHVQDVALIREDRQEKNDSPRIEAYDTAHISGTDAIGVMVVVEQGLPVKKEYRTFLIKAKTGAQKNDDLASLSELLTRRFSHVEWEFPKLIVIDGGKTHKKTAEDTLAHLGIDIPVVAVVKDEKHRPREVLGTARTRVYDADAVLANAEAHRFSLARHRARRSKRLRTQ